MGDEEPHLPFEKVPWLWQAMIQQSQLVERLTAEHLVWPLWDVDFAVPSIRDPAAFLFTAQV